MLLMGLYINNINWIWLERASSFRARFFVGYSIQTALDAKNKLITNFEVTNNYADKGNYLIWLITCLDNNKELY